MAADASPIPDEQPVISIDRASGILQPLYPRTFHYGTWVIIALRARPIKTCFIGITCDSMPLIELIR